MGRQIPEVLTTTEQEALLSQPNPRYLTGERNQTMLRLMLALGLRVAEVTSLKWRNVDLTTCEIRVKNGKGAKDRNLWANEKNIEALRKWRKRQANECKENSEGIVFTTKKGGTLNHAYVRSMVKRYGVKAGIVKDVHPHMLRHTFATNLLRHNPNIRIVQKALGHSNLASTQIYTHICDPELEEALKTLRTP